MNFSVKNCANWALVQSLDTAVAYGAGYVEGMIIGSDRKLMANVSAITTLVHSILVDLTNLLLTKKSSRAIAYGLLRVPIHAIGIVAMRRLGLIAQLGTIVYSLGYAAHLGFYLVKAEALRQRGE